MSRAAIIAGSVIGIGVLVCGLGGLLAAALGGAWWYGKQPVQIHFAAAALEVERAAPLPVPSATMRRRYGDPEPLDVAALWTVEPATLGTVAAGVFTPRAPGEGLIRACDEGVCGELDLRVAMASAMAVEPARVVFRIWDPVTLKATPTWEGDPVTVPLTWTSSDPKVVTVDASGALKPISVGTADITVTGGGMAATSRVRVYGEPPTPCTLAAYADAIGRTGRKTESKQCQPEGSDFCEWTSSQSLADGGRIDEGGGWEWSWTTLWLPAGDADQIWRIASRCMDLPPEIAGLNMLELLADGRKGEMMVPLSGEWVTERAAATVQHERGAVHVELPVECYSNRLFGLDGQWMKIGVAEGC